MEELSQCIFHITHYSRFTRARKEVDLVLHRELVHTLRFYTLIISPCITLLSHYKLVGIPAKIGGRSERWKEQRFRAPMAYLFSPKEDSLTVKDSEQDSCRLHISILSYLAACSRTGYVRKNIPQYPPVSLIPSLHPRPLDPRVPPYGTSHCTFWPSLAPLYRLPTWIPSLLPLSSRSHPHHPAGSQRRPTALRVQCAKDGW